MAAALTPNPRVAPLREGFEFSDDDYRSAMVSGTNAQPDSAGDLEGTSRRRLVGEERWIDVIDDVVVGG